MKSISRRALIKSFVGFYVSASAAPCLAQKASAAKVQEPEKIINVASAFDCGGKCIVLAHIKNGTLTRISTQNTNNSENMPIMKACIRGRAYKNMQYAPDRLKYPLKRTGKRGEGKFIRISWDEATTVIADKIKNLTAKYGAESRFCTLNTAQAGGIITGDAMIKRLLNLTGGYLPHYHSVSMGNAKFVTPYTYGSDETGSTINTLLHSKLIILWGHNPAETIFGHTNYYLSEYKKRGGKIIVVDPRHSDSAAAYADEWIPLLPTTDNALMDAMAYVIITRNLHDKEFIKQFTIGFDEDSMPKGVDKNESLVSYLLGAKDGIKKTPKWAEKICKVPASKIISLAKEYAAAKPAALIQGWGPQRHSCGERTSRGATILASITGNVGVKGGWAAGLGYIAARKYPSAFPEGNNPVKASISIMNWTDAVDNASKLTHSDGLKGAEKLNTNIKMIFCIGSNYLAGQNPDINKSKSLLKDESKVEFILNSDLFLTPSAMYADIVLPAASFLERWDLPMTWGTGNYFILSKKVLEPEFERKTDYEWISIVADKLGVGKEFTQDRSLKDWAKYLYEETVKQHVNENIPSFDMMLKKHERVYRFQQENTYVAFEKQITDPQLNPFPTPSGKIEIFSKRLYDMNNSEIPALSHYYPAWEGPYDHNSKQFPFQLITWKSKHRSNSTFSGVPWLIESYPQTLWINPADADAKNIKNGDMLKVYNKRGSTYIKAEITSRIIQGVVATPSGAWHSPDKNGDDTAGSVNVLTTDRKTSLAGGNAHQSILVQIIKV